MLNCEAALFALEHADEYAKQAATIRAEREKLQRRSRALPGVRAFPSEANMILVRVPDAKRVFEGMKARGVLVKNVAGLHPLLANCIRITIGTPDENPQTLAALRGALRRTDVMSRPTAPPTSSATPRKRRSASASTSTAPASSKLATGIGFFDHMLDQIARHGLIDLDIHAVGDLHIDGHHTVEDVGITLGQAVAQAVGDKKGLTRYGHAYVPLDEALSRVVVDFSGRPGLHMDVDFKAGMIGAFDTQLALRVLPGLLQPRRRVAAHRQPEGPQRAPPGRDDLQGLRRARCAWR